MVDDYDEIAALIQEGRRLGLKVDAYMSKWRNKYPREAVDGVLVKVPAGFSLTLNGKRPIETQAYVLREAIKAIDLEPSEPEWERYEQVDSWIRPIVAPVG